MASYLIRRLWQMIPTLLGVLLLVFALFNWVGGDPAYILAGKITNPEQIANIRKQLGLDEPYYIQFWIFVRQIVTLDFGHSWSTGEPVMQIMTTRLGPSLTILVPLVVLETVLAIGLALAVAYVRGSLTDRLIMMICTIGMSISILVYIIVFQYWFAYKLGFFPVQGWGDSFSKNLFHFSLLPIIILLPSPSHPICAFSEPLFWTRSDRTTSGLHGPKASPNPASCGFTSCAMRQYRSLPMSWHPCPHF